MVEVDCVDMKKGQKYTLAAAGIEVEVERKPVRRVNLRVRPDGSAHMSVPWSVSRAEAQSFLDGHAEWLARAIGRVRAREAERSGSGLGAGGLVPLWGRLVPAPADGDVAGLYRAELARALPDVVARMEAASGQHALGWQLRDMRTRWGSCTPATGRIRVNTRLAAYPPTCLDYVVAHELTHLAEPPHNARFHRLLALAYPDEAAARALLRKEARDVADWHLS